MSVSIASRGTLLVCARSFFLAVCLALFGLLPRSAHSTIPAGIQYYFVSNVGQSDPFPKPIDACVDLGVKIGAATEFRQLYYCYWDNRRWGGYGFELTDRRATSYCPPNSTAVSGGCACQNNYQEDPSKTFCVAKAPPERIEPQSCKAPSGAGTSNPIIPATGEKYRRESDFTDASAAPLGFYRIYRSNWGLDASRTAGPFGKSWSHNYSAHLKVTSTDAAGSATSAAIVMPEGYERTFYKATGASTWTATIGPDTLTQVGGTTWSYHRSEDDSTLTFDGAGKLQTEVGRNGWSTSYTYNGGGQLTAVRNHFNRALGFAYNAAGQLTTVTTPDARTIGYSYDAAGRLVSVAYPDTKTRSFLYENAAFPHALTGIVDEGGVRWGTFAYDTQGRAVSSELAGAIERYQVSYSGAGAATIVDPLGTSRGYSYATNAGKLAVTGGSLPSGIGEPDAASRVQDANGLITRETDFRGVVTTTTWDVARRLPLSVTRALGTPEAQTTATQWHATFSLPTLVTEAGRSTAYTYDASGNLLSRAVTDTSTSPNTTRTWQWTYNAQGLAATATEPNGAVTTYEYDALGNLTKATNALGHATLYAYDSANRIVGVTAPNGLLTEYAYNPRDWATNRTVGGQQSTSVIYNDNGTVLASILPSGMLVAYSWDAAHRLTGWNNTLGERGTFTLDAMGNRVGEQITDSSGGVAWNTARTINNINRVSVKTDGPNQTHMFGYDANGELVADTNGLNQLTQFGLDPLRRVKAVTNAANATATLAYNALDDVSQAKDFKGVATSYARDAMGNATSETSADTGSSSTQYDSLGLPSQIVDALGQATQIQRDALGRPTQLTFADGKITTLRYDLTGGAYNAAGAPNASKGYLSEIQDRSGITSYKRDVFGRVVQKTHALSTGLILNVQYSYTESGQLSTIINPAGHTQQFVYDNTGRITRVDWDGVPQIADIRWSPLGQPTDWMWAQSNGGTSPDLVNIRSYDTAGRLTRVNVGGQTILQYLYDAAGRVQSLTQVLAKPVDPTDPNTMVTEAAVDWTVGYDAAGRVTSFETLGNNASFSYDANGNRLSSTQTVGGQTTARSYTIAGASNRLAGFNQTIGGSATSVTYGYNTNGDLTNDGLRTFSYDAEGRLSAVTTGGTDTSPTTRYAHNALGQRVFKTEPLYPPGQGDEADPGFMASLIAFFTKFWAPATTDAERLGYAYAYDEDGTLLGEFGAGGADSTGRTEYMWLPTSNGPLPVMMFSPTARYAVHADHLNTPRRLTQWDGQLAWQWSYSAFGETQPTVASRKFASVAPVPGELEFNLRYPGQTADRESGLFYNYFRSYSPTSGRYTQVDPIGLDGGWNRFGYVDSNPLIFTDPLGLQTTVDAAIRNALGKGDIAELETLLEAANPSQAAAIRSGIEKFGSRATDWIAKNCRGSINREFPGELRDKTLKEIMDQSKSGDSVAKKAWKLLNDNRFKK